MKQRQPFALRGKRGIRWSDEHGKRRKAIFANQADAEHVLAYPSPHGRHSTLDAWSCLTTQIVD